MTRRYLAIGVATVVVVFAGEGCAAHSSSEEAGAQSLNASDDQLAADASLEEVVRFLGDDVRSRSPGTELAISVNDLQTKQSAQLNGDVKQRSASAVKAVWVAAALKKVGKGPVDPLAMPIFRDSDNIASGKVVDLVGPNAMNGYYDEVGMKDSGFISWNYGGAREATNRARALGEHNYVTANDATRFLTRLGDRTLLTEDLQAVLSSWMKASPRSGLGGWLGARLPAAAKASMMHKAGWLPPDAQTNELGVIDTAADGSHRYVVAILARHGRDYDKQGSFVEYASCAIYRAIAKTPSLKCADDETLSPAAPGPTAPPKADPVPNDQVAPPPPAPVQPAPSAGRACAVAGNHCGSNGVSGEPSELFRCEGGTATRIEVCANGCIAIPPGGGDICRP